MGWVVLGVECMLMCMGSELCCGWLQCSCCTESEWSNHKQKLVAENVIIPSNIRYKWHRNICYHSISLDMTVCTCI